MDRLGFMGIPYSSPTLSPQLMATVRNNSTNTNRRSEEVPTQPNRAKPNRNGNNKQKALKSAPSSAISPVIRPVALNAINGIHDAVPKEWIGTFPLELGDPRVLSQDALKHLILQHPIGVVSISGKKKHKTQNPQQQYAVVTGLATWTTLQRNLKESLQNTSVGDNTSLHRSSRINVIDYGQIEDSERIAVLAKMDFWLALAMHLPASKVRDNVYAKAQKAIRSLIATHTPQLKQQKLLADTLDKHRSTLTKKKSLAKQAKKTKTEPS